MGVLVSGRSSQQKPLEGGESPIEPTQSGAELNALSKGLLFPSQPESLQPSAYFH